MSTMETMAKKQPRPRRSFTPEFKSEVVELVRQPGNRAGSVARDLNLTETAVRAWVKQADLDQGRRSDGLTSEQTVGDGPAAQGTARGPRGARDLEAGRGFLRSGDSV